MCNNLKNHLTGVDVGAFSNRGGLTSFCISLALTSTTSLPEIPNLAFLSSSSIASTSIPEAICHSLQTWR